MRIQNTLFSGSKQLRSTYENFNKTSDLNQKSEKKQGKLNQTTEKNLGQLKPKI